ncbi:MAG: response regulator [Myxococcota bacterium]|nr:response regulator [Myxococcota bacterium]
MNANAAPPVVLVADDEPTMLELVARHLRSISQPKLEVIEASDGDEAWKIARDRLPDLVVLDVMMPGMSGWEVCRKIRQDAALAHTGVLMLTGIGESLNETTSPLFGADEYIDKPFDFEELDAKIRSVLERRAAQRESVPRPKSQTSLSARRSEDDLGNGVGARSGAAAPKKKGSRASAAKSLTSRAAARAKPHAGGAGATKKMSAKAKKGTAAMAAKKAKTGAKKSAKKAAKKTAAKKSKKK